MLVFIPNGTYKIKLLYLTINLLENFHLKVHFFQGSAHFNARYNTTILCENTVIIFVFICYFKRVNFNNCCNNFLLITYFICLTYNYISLETIHGHLTPFVVLVFPFHQFNTLFKQKHILKKTINI